MDAEKYLKQQSNLYAKASNFDGIADATLGNIMFEIFASNPNAAITKQDVLSALDKTIAEYAKGTIKYERANAVITRLRSENPKHT